MKLFIFDKNCRRKIYLANNAKTRYQLAQQWGTYFNITCPHCSYFGTYSVDEVYAEKSSENSTLPIAAIGGLIGLLAGPAGALAGGTIGGLIGLGANDKEIREVNRFNNSRV